MKSELDLGKLIVDFWKSENFDIYQEVRFHGQFIDIVGKLDNLIMVTELKLSLSFDLLEQAIRKQAYAHMVWVAVPAAKRRSSRHMAEKVFEKYGIGILEVHKKGLITVRARPNFNRRARTKDIKDNLIDEKRDFALAGSATVKRWTPFKATQERLIDLVRSNPGITLKEAITKIKHHYASNSSARACLIKYIEKGIISEIELRKDGKKLLLFLTSNN